MTHTIASAGALLIADGVRNIQASKQKELRQKDEARGRARRALEAQGIKEPTQEEIRSTDQLATEIRKHPFDEQDPIAKSKARDVERAVKIFNDNYQTSLAH
jgi:hypothetical protein